MMFGGGGYNGTVPNLAQNVPFGPVDQRTPLGRGYATYASDSGHQADTTRHPIASLDGWFGQNDEAVRNFSGDALKKVHDTATYVIRRPSAVRPARPTSPAARPVAGRPWRSRSAGRATSTG